MPCSFKIGPWGFSKSPGCQFAAPEDELINFDGKDWCAFHLPLKVGEVESEKARWDAARIRRFSREVLGCFSEENPYALVDLSGVVFPKGTTFPNIWAGVQFNEAFFCGGVSFEQGHFQGNVRFDGATFLSSAGFEEVKFCRTVSFNGATFSGEAAFDETVFEHDAGFVRATFVGNAHFEDSTFLSGAVFLDAMFSTEARFDRATFQNVANFDGATFSGDALFTGGSIGGPNGTFPSVDFVNANFQGRAVFVNRQFLNTTDFRNATFNVAPEFHNSILHQDTRLSGTRFLDRSHDTKLSLARFIDRKSDAASAYRTLKLAMGSLRATDEEAQFYAYEQQALRARKDTDWWVKLASWLYEKTSDYGRNFWLPFRWLLVSFAAFFLVYLATLTGAWITWEDGGCVFRFALQQVFHPFGALRTEEAAESIPLWLALLAALHSVLNFAFLTLLLLALRRRFRLN